MRRSASLSTQLLFSIVLSSLLTSLLALPAAGQALGLGELVQLRRASAKKASKLLQARGWEVKVALPTDSTGFTMQTWEPVQNGTADSTRLSLRRYTSTRRHTYFVYIIGDHISPPAISHFKKKIRHGEVVRKRIVLFYSDDPLQRNADLNKMKYLFRARSSSGQYRSGGCGFHDEYIGPSVLVDKYYESGTPDDCHCTTYTIKRSSNLTLSLLLALFGR